MTCLTSKTIIAKKPGEVLNVSMDFSAWLNDGETISSPSVNVEPSGELTIDNINIDGDTVEFIVGAGNIGTYKVNVTVETSDGETLIGTGKLSVRS